VTKDSFALQVVYLKDLKIMFAHKDTDVLEALLKNKLVLLEHTNHKTFLENV
jgi:hypothetical protein